MLCYSAECTLKCKLTQLTTFTSRHAPDLSLSHATESVGGYELGQNIRHAILWRIVDDGVVGAVASFRSSARYRQVCTL